tara:strand:- start:143 stop:460 length:318 start_codon:yes stop_codon:yes gene_type:complete
MGRSRRYLFSVPYIIWSALVVTSGFSFLSLLELEGRRIRNEVPHTQPAPVTPDCQVEEFEPKVWPGLPDYDMPEDGDGPRIAGSMTLEELGRLYSPRALMNIKEA